MQAPVFYKRRTGEEFFYKGRQGVYYAVFRRKLYVQCVHSYIKQTPSNYSIIALEPIKVTLISYDKMVELCKKYHCMETFFSKLVSLVAIKMMKRISSMLEENAEERYNQFVKENKAIIQRISLGDLAQYLGITQQSLSRIRAQK
jgi:CRP/FNR family transcriptional regulator, anaerobic regulatory protein